MYGANVVEKSYSAKYDTGWTLRYRNPDLLSPNVAAKLSRQRKALAADPSVEWPTDNSKDLEAMILMPMPIGVFAGALIWSLSRTATVGVIVGVVVCLGLWILFTVGAVKGHLGEMPVRQAARAELKARTFTSAEGFELRGSIVEVPIPNPTIGRLGKKFEPVRAATKEAPPHRRVDPLELLERLAAEAHQLSRDIEAADSWRDPQLLAAHHVQFDPAAEEQEILDHIAGLHRAFVKLGDNPRGSTGGAVIASSAYTRAVAPLESVLDTVIARVTALHRYDQDLRLLDIELGHARVARRALELDEDTAELFASAVGNEFAIRHLDSLSEHTRVVSAAINELVKSLNGDLRTLSAFSGSKDPSSRRH
ncbi:hypothetical protein HQ305_19985 [Rhodococcus sp. BP-149]|uniref:hypothetical protein n=1 Tax=unclassified Rhodococcus (in: high G+C Gram-positive bacteria) TaxID=192944 RepID=UPI001C9A3D27|nr:MULTISPECIES: hypothetical protein [unclassified Rhodococcus (in: high G+C Gram-positive bacteria)]MBY6687516.1 hypothetical protein [Rhodococcus sp. BP-288]MBY6695681.1 hypothetical protein [Rhodococcus sp. BP-188]MBY6700521.1 hypothetical protein [Rhodococcus sp. BP-285]MBY6704456.1 hypothetical protein [Rhodococcus sp. BP-283]MBY6713646.1 hypothetical protein [Rhodococcus sp. BP-160]